MLLDHRQDVASEMQAGWRSEAHHERLSGGGRAIAEPGQGHAGLSRVKESARSFMHAHHAHVPLHLHAFSRGH
jgi:hypothetical protein